jgi:hypothetical protein
MTKAGILLHVRHPETVGWETLVWGMPEEDRLGCLPTLVMLLLRESADEPFEVLLVGTTAAKKGGLLDGEYTKKFLLDRFDQLSDFPRLKKLLAGLNKAQLAALRQRLEDIIITPAIVRTSDEVPMAAKFFTENDVKKVVQVTCASHGPRCLQDQAICREKGLIPKDQLWSVVVDDMCYEDSTAISTLILEVPHRGDDPMTGYKPLLAEVMRPYWYDLTGDDKKKLVHKIDEFMKQHKQ